MNTESYIIDKYGPLLSYADLSSILKRSKDGVRISLSSNSEFARTWNTAKVKIGRRVYFKTVEIARLIDEGIDK